MANKPKSADMHPGPGFRVRLEVPRKINDDWQQLSEFDTADISDMLNRLYAVNSEIRCLTNADHNLCGPACTVKVFPGDNLMVHKVLDVAKPGDVVVIDGHGSSSNAVLGDIICTKAQHRGIAGFVVDGLIRDLPAIAELDYPVFARGTTSIGPMHRGPGEINYPVCCGGVVTHPGDIIVADAAGIVVVPSDIVDELLWRLQEFRQTQAVYLDAVQRGDFSNEWVDRVLNESNCPVVESEFNEILP